MSNQKESCGYVEKQVANTHELHTTIVERERANGKHLLSLDDYMLLYIFDYLALDSLLSLYTVNRRLNELIKSHRIYRETIVLAVDEYGEYYPVILDVLSHTTKLSIKLKNQNLNTVFEMIATRCGVGNLKEIEIICHHYHKKRNTAPVLGSNGHTDVLNSGLLREKLNNVTKFTLSANCPCEQIDPKFATLITNLNLESLVLDNMDVTRGYLTAMSTLRYLTNVELKYCERISFKRFDEVMRKIGGQLTSLTWIGCSFYEHQDRFKLWNVVKSAMPNLKKLCLKTWFCDCESNFSSFNDLSTLTTIQSLTIKVNDSCDCRKLHLFLNRLCSLRTLTKLDFSWRGLFLPNDDQNIIANRCKNLLGIQDLRLKCSFSRMDWNAFKEVLPNLREFTSVNKIDFKNEQNKEKFKLMLRNGPKLTRVTARMGQISDEFYQSLVQICKSDRSGKGITIYVPSWSKRLDFLPELSSYDEKYVKIVAKILFDDDDDDDDDDSGDWLI